MKKFLAVCIVLVLMLAATGAMADQYFGSWTLKAFVDEFDLPTNDYYAVTTTKNGHFSNSATNRSDLTAVVFFQNWSDTKTAFVKIRLFEYGNNRVSNNSSKNRAYYDVLVMDTAGNKISMTGFIPTQGTELAFYTFTANDDNAKLVKILSAGSGTVRFSITKRDNPLNKYVFAIELDGLQDACKAGHINMNP